MIFFQSNNFSIQVDETKTCRNDNGLLWLAPVRLVIDGYHIGTLESETYIPSFIYGIGEKILSPSSIYFNNQVNSENYKDFFSNLDRMGSSNYVNMLEETFDDFFFRTVRNDDFVFCACEMVDSPFFSYENPVKNKKQFSIISLIDLNQVVNQFKKWSNSY